MRLDQLIQKSLGLTRKQARVLLSTRTVVVNGIVNMNGGTRLSDFDKVMKDTQVLQQRIPRYLLLHKPIGIVSATIDQEHTTVIDLIREPWADELHLAGRLDRASSGLVVLTNDGHYSRKLT
ncbi:MAG: 16S rRNA pseudouridine516 synthase, partial [Verrucomicrobiales bacterium]